MRCGRQSGRGGGDTETSSPAVATCCAEPPFTHGKGSAAQSCPTLCDPTDCSPPGSSAHGIPQRGYWTGLPFPSPGDLPEPHTDASRYFYLPGRQSGELKDTGRETRLPGFESRFGKTRERVPWSRLLSPCARGLASDGCTPWGNGSPPLYYSPGHTAGALPPPGSWLPALPPTPPSMSGQVHGRRLRHTGEKPQIC